MENIPVVVLKLAQDTNRALLLTAADAGLSVGETLTAIHLALALQLYTVADLMEREKDRAAAADNLLDCVTANTRTVLAGMAEKMPPLN